MMGDPFRCTDCDLWFEELEDLDHHLREHRTAAPSPPVARVTAHPPILGLGAMAGEDGPSRDLALRQQTALREAYVTEANGGRPLQIIESYLQSMRESEPEEPDA